MEKNQEDINLLLTTKVDELISRTQKTSVSLVPNKTLAEIDGNPVNDLITFTGTASISTFGDFGSKQIDPSEFSNISMKVDGIDIPITLLSNSVKGTKQFSEDSNNSQTVGNHTALYLFDYLDKHYEATCNISVNLRKFFFFWDDLGNNFLNFLVNLNFLVTLLGVDITTGLGATRENKCEIVINDEFSVEGISHFSNSKECTVVIPASLEEGFKYVYILIPVGMSTNKIEISQPEAFNAAFEVTPINDVTRILPVWATNSEEDGFLYYQYHVFRSTYPIYTGSPKKLTVN